MPRLRIELLSDLCSSSGENYGASIDNDVCYDDYGFPFIPAKRLKGCLRECAADLLDWELITFDIDEIFGKRGETEGRLMIEDAYLENYSLLLNEVKGSQFKNYLHQQNILENYTYIRAQTALENEVAKKNSLRFTRVVKKDTVFFCGYLLKDSSPSDFQTDLSDFEKCCKALTRMGLNRTRGLGNVKITLDDGTNREILKLDFNKPEYTIPSAEENNEFELKLGFQLISSMLFPSAEGDATKTETFIPGSSIMGFFASRYARSGGNEFKKLFIDGNLIFQNGYISTNGENRFLPASAAIVKIKDSDYTVPCLNKLVKNEGDTEKFQSKAIGDRYLLNGKDQDEKQIARILSVDIEVCYHHKQSEDSKNDREFYQYTSISKDQIFVCKIVGKGKFLKQILELLPEDGIMTFGRSKNAQYGRAMIITSNLINLGKVKNTAASQKCLPINKFVVQLNSPCIVLNDNGVASTDIQLLTREIEKRIGNISIKPIITFLRYKTVGGFNVKWKLPKQQMLAFNSGTVCVYEIDEEIEKGKTDHEIDISLLQNINIGERISEGFGEIIVYPYNTQKAKIILAEKAFSEKESNNTSNAASMVTAGKSSIPANSVNSQIGEVLRPIVKRIITKQLGQIASRDAGNKDKQESINSTTVGRLTLMCKENGTLESFINSVGSIKDTEKKNKCFKILFSRDTSSSEAIIKYLFGKVDEVEILDDPSLKSYNKAKPFIDIDEIYKIYTKVLLTQLKFNLRQKKGEFANV